MALKYGQKIQPVIYHTVREARGVFARAARIFLIPAKSRGIQLSLRQDYVGHLESLCRGLVWLWLE